MRGMLYAVPKADDEWLTFDRAAVLRLADDLENAEPWWSPGQYSASLASLMEEK